MSGPGTRTTPHPPTLMRTTAAVASPTATRQKPRAKVPPIRVYRLVHRLIRLKVREIVRLPLTDQPAKNRICAGTSNTPPRRCYLLSRIVRQRLKLSTHAPHRARMHPAIGGKLAYPSALQPCVGLSRLLPSSWGPRHHSSSRRSATRPPATPGKTCDRFRVSVPIRNARGRNIKYKYKIVKRKPCASCCD
jgi:hypothetical protein